MGKCGSQNKTIKYMQVNLGTLFSNSLFKGEHFEADYKKELLCIKKSKTKSSMK